MNYFLLVTLLIVTVCGSLPEEHRAMFQKFKLTHRKIYKNQVEEIKRFTIFKDNLRAIEEHNQLYEQGLVSYKKGINRFADMNQEEFRALLNTHPKPSFNATQYIRTGIAVPASVDWRSQGRVTGVKDQGECGSCWAFSVTGSTEGAYARKSAKLVSLSEQQLVDCATEFSSGCYGGELDSTFIYIEKNGLESEEDYPYKDADGRCKYESSKIVTKVSDYVSISKDENALLEAVASVGPVSVAMDASSLGDYSSGIYSDKWCSPEGLNHGVLIVGYGSENGKDYWIVKNSWGASWGEEGYFKIVRGTNECGIAEDDVYPIIN